jgi:hypothetical protein
MGLGKRGRLRVDQLGTVAESVNFSGRRRDEFGIDKRAINIGA